MSVLKELSKSYYYEALDNIKNNNITKAVELLEEAIKIDSNNVDINNVLGLCYFKLCSFNKAMDFFEKNNSTKYIEFMKSTEVTTMIEKFYNSLNKINGQLYNDALEDLLSIDLLKFGLIDVDILISLIYLRNGDVKKSYQYIKSALDKDLGNTKAHEYYRVISENITENNVDNTKFSKTKNRYKFGSAALLIVTIISISFMVSISNKNKAHSDLVVSKNIEITEELRESEIKLIVKEQIILDLEESLKSLQQKLEGLLNSNEIGLAINELELLKVALEAYNEKELSEVYENLTFIIKNSSDYGMINEATYWLARCYEEDGNIDMAIETYKDYIDKFYGYNYYDDSLYTLSTKLYSLNNVEEAKLYGNKLISECSDSIYNNSIIKGILNN